MRKSDFSHVHFLNGGLFSSEKEWIHPRCRIDSHEIILVTNGTFPIAVGEDTYSLSSGSFLLMPAQVEHAGTEVAQCPVSFYWFHFYGTVSPQPFTGNLKDNTSVLLCAKQLLHIYSSGLYPKETADYMLRVLMAELEVKKSLLNPENALVSKVSEYIRSHADTRLPVTAIAEHFGYSPDYLSRLMKKTADRTLQQTVTEARMERARFLLQTTGKNVAEIAYQLHFEEPNLFEKFFIYHQKCTPKQYRNSFYSERTNHE